MQVPPKHTAIQCAEVDPACLAAFESELQTVGSVGSEGERTVHLDEHGLWGCDEYGCDVLICTDFDFARAYVWSLEIPLSGHPAEFSY